MVLPITLQHAPDRQPQTTEQLTRPPPKLSSPRPTVFHRQQRGGGGLTESIRLVLSSGTLEEQFALCATHAPDGSARRCPSTFATHPNSPPKPASSCGAQADAQCGCRRDR